MWDVDRPGDVEFVERYMLVLSKLFEVEWIGVPSWWTFCAQSHRWRASMEPLESLLGMPANSVHFAFLNNLMQLFQKLTVPNLWVSWWPARRALEILLSNGANVELRVYSLLCELFMTDLSRVMMAFFVLNPILEELQRSPSNFSWIIWCNSCRSQKSLTYRYNDDLEDGPSKSC